MKLSTKLLIGLLGTMLVMMLISAFSIKNEFEKVNQKDLFWNSIKISNKPFKHLKVIGQKDAEGTVNILNGKFFGNSKKFEINIPKQWAEEVKISFEKDTLIVNFLVKPIKNNNSNYRQNSAVMHIICGDCTKPRVMMAILPAKRCPDGSEVANGRMPCPRSRRGWPILGQPGCAVPRYRCKA